MQYDANGNIKSMSQMGLLLNNSQLIDKLTYTYQVNSNKLLQVTDAANDVAAGDYEKYKDIKQGQLNGNYTYDAIGNLTSDVSEGITNIEWTVYGKISKITKIKNGLTTIITYTYDPSGNRITKEVTPQGAASAVTFYVRDASGNVMAVYETQNNTLALKELHKYGSSRLGIVQINPSETQPTILQMPLTNGEFGNIGKITNFTVGTTFFELSNHLGNVLVTITDRRLQIQNPSLPQQVLGYEADVVTATDYYPFGMAMPGRTYTATTTSGFRYGFNGQELDEELNWFNFGMREYDPRICRLIGVDPLTYFYSYYTPYQFAGNTPIEAIDILGMQGGGATVASTSYSSCLTNSNWRSSLYVYPSTNTGGQYVPSTSYAGIVEPTPEMEYKDFKSSLAYENAKSKYAPGSYIGYQGGYGTNLSFRKAGGPTGDAEYLRKIVGLKNPEKGILCINNSNLENNFGNENQFNPFEQYALKTQIPQSGLAKEVLVQNKTKNTKKEFWVTYTKTNPTTGQVYSGRSSGYYTGDAPTKAEAEAAVAVRNSGHKILNDEGFERAKLDKFSTNYDPIRGREQYLVDFNGGAQSDNGISRNKIRGVGRNNPNKTTYMNAAKSKGWSLPNKNPNKTP